MVTANGTPWTVDELASGIKTQLRKLQNIDVVGTVGQVARPASGHTYFEMIGAKAHISCVAFANDNLSVHELSLIHI